MTNNNYQALVTLSNRMNVLIDDLLIAESLKCESSIEAATVNLEHLRGDAACDLDVTPEAFMKTFWSRYNKATRA